MGPWHGCWGSPLMWVGCVIGLMVMGLIVYLLVRVLGERARGKTEQQDGADTRTESALEILKRRYARGELTREEFERMKQDIT